MRKNKAPVILLLLFIGCILITGCTSNESAPVQEKNPVTEITVEPTPEITIEPVQSDINKTLTEEASEFDLPVSNPPADLAVSVSAQKDQVYGTITVVFDGGYGQDLVKSIDVKVTLSDGTEQILPLVPAKGSEITVDGTKGEDRVEAVVSFMNGDSYKVLDKTLTMPHVEEPEVTDAPTKAPVAEDDGLFAGPVEQPPDKLSVSVSAEKEPIYRVITATFLGGHGQSLVSSIKVHTILSDGRSTTTDLSSDIGATTEIQGTSGTDKIQVMVYYKNGESYKILEQNLGPRG